MDASDNIDGFTEDLDSTNMPKEFFPYTSEEADFNKKHNVHNCLEEPCGARWAVWPGQPVYNPYNNQVLIFYHKIYAEPGSYNFKGIGHSITLWQGFGTDRQRPVFNIYPPYIKRGLIGDNTALFLKNTFIQNNFWLIDVYIYLFCSGKY